MYLDRKPILAALLIALISAGCSDDTVSPAPEGHIRVPQDHPTIQLAINAASPGDTVVIATGVYTDLHEYTDFIGRTLQVAGALKQGVVVRGATGNPADVIIDPQGAGWGFWCREVDGTTGLAALTVRNALWACSGSDASPWIDNCIFEENGDLESQPNSAGTGMYFDRSSSLVTDCIFRDNVAHGGAGATFSTSSDVRFERCSFLNNHATSSGGGLSVANDSQATLVDCLVDGNSAVGRGGGIDVHGNSLEMIGGAITENSAGDEGGGLLFAFAGNARLEDVTVTDNVAPVGPQGCVWDGYDVELVCCDTDPAGWEGSVTVTDEGCE